jgi:hypothetical protein
MPCVLRPALWGSLVLAAVAVTACGGSENPNPTTPTVDTQIQVFSGTLTVNGAQNHVFTVPRQGGVLAVLSDLTPDGDTVGFFLGTQNGTLCTRVIAAAEAVEGTRIVGATSTAGELCVQIHDVGRLAASVSYEIQVEYPEAAE